MTVRSALRFLCSALLCLAPLRVAAQTNGAAPLARNALGFGTTVRVLLIGAHPDDEDTGLITWLALGRNVETAYLSLTRGDGGQNLIGNELGEALGAIRTEELLAARRMDGGHQYFTRAFDFGFSKDSAETLTHWPREEILGDVVKVIRAFRPHVIIAMFSGTAADGHGHHTVSGVFARDAYDVSGDTARFPTEKFGASWTAAKFYRALRGTAAAGAVKFNVGEFDPVLGRSYAEIAAESRTQHKSQGQGRLAADGVQWNYVRREATRVNATIDVARETTIFDGIDTSWARFRETATTSAQRALVDSMPAIALAVRAALELRAPATVVPMLANAVGLLERARNENKCRFAVVALSCAPLANDLGATIEVAHRRAREALLAAASVKVEVFSDREYLAVGDTGVATLHTVNRGSYPVKVRVLDGSNLFGNPDTSAYNIAADSVVDVTRPLVAAGVRGQAWWIDDRAGFDFFPDLLWNADGVFGLRYTRSLPSVSGIAVAEDAKRNSVMDTRIEIAGVTFTHRIGPFEFRRADVVAGEVRRPLVTLEAVSLLFDRSLELMRANQPVDRVIRLRVRSYSTRPRPLNFQYRIPKGLVATGLPDTLTIGPLETRDISIRVKGIVGDTLQPMTAMAIDRSRLERREYGAGYFTLVYDHIRQIVLKRASGLWVRGIDVAIQPNVQVAYIPGVSDDIAAVLRQLDVAVTIVEPERFGSTDLKPYDVIILGPRVYARAPALAAFNDRLEDFARNGGTVIVQYGQQEMTRPGMLPFRIDMANPAQRVTREDAPVRVLDSTARVLTTPNRIRNGDFFAGWMQERAVYMPSAADTAWKPVLEMHDPDEPPNNNALLIARLGKGRYVYTALSFLRQVPAGNDGAIKFFMNLIALGQRTPAQ